MNTVDSVIQGLLGGLLFAIVGGIFFAIKRGANKMINKKKIEIEKELNFDYIREDLSDYEKIAILELLFRIVRCDGEINKKEEAIILIFFSILGVDKLSQKTIENIENELENLSNDELLQYLSNFEWKHKEWFTKAMIYLIESDYPITEQERNSIKPILSYMGITKEQLNEIKNRINQYN